METYLGSSNIYDGDLLRKYLTDLAGNYFRKNTSSYMIGKVLSTRLVVNVTRER